MNGQTVQSALNPLWASYIDWLETDLRSHRITIDLTTHEIGTQSRHKLVFDAVASFYFVAAYGSARFDQEFWDNAELSEIYYFEESQRNEIVQTCSKPGVREHQTAANFVLEIWDAELFIEANSVTIDGKRYEVGYPHERASEQGNLAYPVAESEPNPQPAALLAEDDDAVYRAKKDAGDAGADYDKQRGPIA